MLRGGSNVSIREKNTAKRENTIKYTNMLKTKKSTTQLCLGTIFIYLNVRHFLVPHWKHVSWVFIDVCVFGPFFFFPWFCKVILLYLQKLPLSVTQNYSHVVQFKPQIKQKCFFLLSP